MVFPFGSAPWVLGSDAAINPPTDIALSGTTAESSTPSGTVIGTLTATDADVGETFTFELVLDPSGLFTIVGTEFRAAATLPEGSYPITIRVIDSVGAAYDEDFTIEVTTSAVTWSPTDKTASITLTNGNLTVSAVDDNTGTAAVRATAARSSGKYVWAFDPTAINTLYTSFGFAHGDITLNSSLSSTTAGTMQVTPFGASGLYINGVSVGSNQSFSNTDAEIMFAIDFAANKAWMKVGNGHWNNTAGNHPATGTGGWDISSITGEPLFPLATSAEAGAAADMHTANFGASPFLGGIPNGFSSWDNSQSADYSAVTWDPGNKAIEIDLSNGNLTATRSAAAGATRNVKGTLGRNSGKYAYALTYSAATSLLQSNWGVANAAHALTAILTSGNNSGAWSGGDWAGFGVSNTAPPAQVVGTELLFMIDFDAETVQFRVGTAAVVPSAPLAIPNIGEELFYPALTLYNAGDVATANFGASAFVAKLPAGYSSWDGTQVPVIGQVVQPLLYTGNQTARTINGAGFQPDLAIIKQRASAVSWRWFDMDRGTSALSSDSTAAEVAVASAFTSFAADGITISTGTTINQTGSEYVAYCLQEVAQAFEILEYTGTGASLSIAHSLGAVPELIIIKSEGSVSNWSAYCNQLTAPANTKYLVPNLTNAEATSATMWDGADPTSTHFGVGVSASTNVSGQVHIAYLFASKTGVSKVGQYTGTGTTSGATVTCGFRPKMLLIKRADAIGDWILFDNERGTGYSPHTIYSFLNSTAAEATSATGGITFTDTGFQITDSAIANVSGAKYIFLALC